MTKNNISSYLLQSKTPMWSSVNNDAILYRGDALENLRQIPDKSVDCIWTDPPYNLSNDGVTCVAGRMVPVNKGEWDRSRGIEGDFQFNLSWTKECFRILRSTGSIWVTGTLHVHSSVGMALQINGFRLLNDIIWEKTNPPPNLGRRTFTHSTELIFWASKSQKKDRIKYKFNYEKMKELNGGKQMKTVWKLGGPKTKEKEFGKHPTQKPVDLIQRCLMASTDAGDVVIDPFTGSSSTGVAALMLGRKFLGIDNNEEFLELSIKRLMATTPPRRKKVYQNRHQIQLVVVRISRVEGARLWNATTPSSNSGGWWVKICIVLLANTEYLFSEKAER